MSRRVAGLLGGFPRSPKMERTDVLLLDPSIRYTRSNRAFFAIATQHNLFGDMRAQIYESTHEHTHHTSGLVLAFGILC